MNTTPDPEETEREALVDVMERVVDTKLRHLALNPGWGEDGTAISGYAANIVAALVECFPFAARRLSEFEIRREWGETIIRALEDLPGEDGEAVSARSREGYLLAISESVEEIRTQFTPSPETEQETE